MKLNLDTVVSNLVAVLLKWQPLKMRIAVSVLPEVVTLHLPGGLWGCVRAAKWCGNGASEQGSVLRRAINMHFSARYQ